jgi:hypothetical protein
MEFTGRGRGTASHETGMLSMIAAAEFRRVFRALDRTSQRFLWLAHVTQKDEGREYFYFLGFAAENGALNGAERNPPL